MDHLTDDTKTTLLLCAVLGKDKSQNPLTQAEYHGLASWLKQHQLRPADLLRLADPSAAAVAAGVDLQRFKGLLERGVQLGFVIEEWQRSGVWMISRSDPTYPSSIKAHLKEQAPPLLFGIGERSLLQSGGLGIVGTNRMSPDDEFFVRAVAQRCEASDLDVIATSSTSGQLALQRVVTEGGRGVGIVAGQLLQKGMERSARHAVTEGQLLLISSFSPHTSPGLATTLEQHRLLYALADLVVIMGSVLVDEDHVQEEVCRSNPGRLFLYVQDDHSTPAVQRWIKAGGRFWPAVLPTGDVRYALTSLGEGGDSAPNPFADGDSGDTEALDLFDFFARQQTSTDDQLMPESPAEVTINSVYQVVKPLLLRSVDGGITVDELATRLELTRDQLIIWLDKLTAEGSLCRHQSPLRYSLKSTETCLDDE